MTAGHSPAYEAGHPPASGPGRAPLPPRRASDLPLRYNAVDLLERNLATRADEPALLSPGRDLTFGEVASEVGQVGHALLALGVRPGEVVAILCPDTPEWATTFFACLKVGAVSLGMNTLLTPREHAHVLADSRARVLVVHAALLDAAREALAAAPTVERVVVVGGEAAGTMGRARPVEWAAWLRGRPSALTTADTHRDDFGTLSYSSGTTGQAKGIFHAHKDYTLAAQLWGVEVLGLRETDRTFSVAKLFFAYGLGGNLLFPWYAGASVALFPGSPRVATDVLAEIERRRPTILFNAPTGYAAMLAVPDLTERFDLSSLRLGVSAGEALPAPLWRRFRQRTGVTIVDGIGSTENFHIFVSNRPDDVRPGSSGKPVPGYDCRIVDDDGKDAAAGEVGDLLVRGETAALFYLHDSERSRRTFLGEWLHTGDRYSVDDDGYYWHAGRSDDMLKVGGIWVSPVEVESALIEHDAVLECAVVGATDADRLVKPKAFVVLKDEWRGREAGGLAGELVGHCVTAMAAFKRPRWIEFVDELPKTATGKIQRYRLR